MDYQLILIKIIDFKKTCLPCIWNFLFGIYLNYLIGRSVGLDKEKLEIYALVVGIYYDLPVDYTTQLWDEFVKSISNTNVVHGILCAPYWSLILQYAYEKEGILVPEDEQAAEFSLYHFPKTVEDDPDMFPTVARIPNGMLRKVDPTNPILVAYLQTINPSIETSFLLPKSTSGPSKKRKESKKQAKGSPSKPSPEPVEKVVKVTPKKVIKSDKPPKKVTKPVVEESYTPAKEVMSLKSGVLK